MLVKIVKSRFYDSVVASHGETIVPAPTTLVVIGGSKFETYRIRYGV